MRCTIGTCQSPLIYKGGENKEDHGCKNMKCKSRDVMYYGNVKVRSNWYYLAGYTMPFEWIDVHHRRPDYSYHWYALVGDGHQTHLQGIKLTTKWRSNVWNEVTQDYSDNFYKESTQQTLLSVPYRALPANNDFNGEFNKLRDQMMNEWFNQYHSALHTPNPLFHNAALEINAQIDRDFFNALDNAMDYTPVTEEHLKSISLNDIDADTRRLIVLAAKNPNSEAGKGASQKVIERLYKTIPSNCKKKTPPNP